MEIHEIDSMKMEALRTLADANLMVSRAKEALGKLKSEEKDFIESREAKVIERVEAALKESEDLISKTVMSYDAVREWAAEVANIVQTVVFVVELIEARDEAFVEKVKAWEIRCNQQEQKLAHHKRVIESGYILLNSERESIRLAKKDLTRREVKITDERAELDRAIARLKNNRT